MNRHDSQDYVLAPGQSRDPSPVAADAFRDDVLESALRRLTGPESLTLTELLEIERTAAAAARSAELYRLLGERIVRTGEPLLAYDLLSQGLERWSGDVRLRQLLALALARSGATARARTILSGLRGEGHDDAETLGLLARTEKDLASQAASGETARAHLRQASAIYEDAYRRSGLPWPGVNAATTALLLGEAERARSLARQVRAACRELLGQLVDSYWTHATLGEAALVLGDRTEAEVHYREAGRLGHGRIADLSTTRRQARMLLDHLGQDRSWLDRYFLIPRVVTFVGHMIDRPGRPRARFPPGLEVTVAREIAARLEALDAGSGYAAAACGSDILFLEAMLARGGEIHVVLPFAPEEFRRSSVDVVPDSHWGDRFERLLARATQVTIAGEMGAEAGGVEYEYGNLIQDGLAQLRAQTLDTPVTPLAVWDGQTGDGPGGTHSRIAHWQRHGHACELVDLAALARAAGLSGDPPAVAAPRGAPAQAGTAEPRRIMAMLFADAVGFSRLTEETIPRFLRHFLGPIGDLVARSPHAPVFRNTWGDGLFFVFESVEAAGAFALELSDLLAGIDREGTGLPASLDLRIGLHAGPVYTLADPVSGTTNYFGAHVSRAARIEPITPPGHVYASQAFAALATAQVAATRERVALAAATGSTFRCEYVGQVPLAKHYGTFPLYHVRWNLRR